MDSVEYYRELGRRQYAILKQECDALKRDPTVYEQCQTYAKSIRDKIAGMAEQNVENPLQASFASGQGMQGQAGQQGLTQGQQFQGQQGQSGQGSFQGGNYGQQPQS